MRNINSIVIYFTLLLVYGCIEDNGNYVYRDEQDILPINITGLEKEMTALKGSTLKLTPVIENMDDVSRYTYEWFIMEYQAAGSAPVRRNLQEGKDLNWVVNLEPGQWRLNFMVTDTELNIYRRYEIILNITGCPLSSGWYILEDNGEGTELDYITKDGEMYPDALGGRIPGNAVAITYQSGRYYHTVTDENGKTTTLVNLSAFHVLTTQDIHTFNAKDMTLLKKYEDQFYMKPEKCEPQAVLYVSTDLYLQNADKMHYIYGMSPNIGKYSAPVTGVYKLYPAIIPYRSSYITVFDTSSHSFFLVSSMNSSLIPIGDMELDNESYSFTNMPYDIHCVGTSTSSGRDGQSYIVMKHLENEEYILVRVTANFTEGNFTSIRDIPEGSKLKETQQIAPAFGSDFLYFVLGHTIYSYKNAADLALTDKEQELLTFPDDEEIAIIRNVFISGKMNALVVVTNKNDKWKLYIYDLIGESTPEIDPEPSVVYEGEGYARYLMYRN